MEQKFKKILQKTKVWNQGLDPINHTYEGALFQDASWVFAFDESVTTEKTLTAAIATASIEAPKATPVVKKASLSLVLFLGDSFVEGSGEDLLGKMIHAMKLKPGEFHRFSFNEKLEDINDLSKNLVEPTPETKELFEIIKKYKPEVVVSLGATVTNILLGKREKLSGIHGQFFDKKIQIDNDSYTYALTPIFHPDFLIINPNMKRTAWIDLQKVMERVGKI
jgi:uracil-DNA glycosylase family 4